MLDTIYMNERLQVIDGLYDASLQLQLRTLMRLYNSFLGPVTSVTLYRPELVDFSMYGASSTHLPIAKLIPNLRLRGPNTEGKAVPCGGKGISMQQALLGTLGEAGERLLAILGRSDLFVHFGTWGELVSRGRRAISSEELFLFASQQYERPGFPFVPFRPDTPLAWVEGTELTTGHRVLVPAQLVLLNWERPPGETQIGYSTSGGLAFHTSSRQAILHGIYEVIERDAINLRWYCQLPPPRVEVNINAFFAKLGYGRARMSTALLPSIRVFLNTVDVPIPVFSAIAEDVSREDKALLSGGGAWGRRERALMQALFEVGQMRASLRLFSDEWKHITSDSGLSELVDFFDAPVWYGYTKNLSLLPGCSTPCAASASCR